MAPACTAALALSPNRQTPCRPAGQDHCPPASGATRRSCEPAEAEHADNLSPALPCADRGGPGQAPSRLCGAGAEIPWPRCHHCHRHLAQHALHRRRPDTPWPGQADIAGSAQSAQGGSRGIDRLCRQLFSSGSPHARQGGRSCLDRGSRYQHNSQVVRWW